MQLGDHRTTVRDQRFSRTDTAGCIKDGQDFLTSVPYSALSGPSRRPHTAPSDCGLTCRSLALAWCKKIAELGRYHLADAIGFTQFSSASPGSWRPARLDIRRPSTRPRAIHVSISHLERVSRAFQFRMTNLDWRQTGNIMSPWTTLPLPSALIYHGTALSRRRPEIGASERSPHLLYDRSFHSTPRSPGDRACSCECGPHR
jgi:hypothetical protein